MTLSGIPVADPYFAAVRRPHPAPTAAPVDDEVVAAVLARVGFFTAELWATLGSEHDPDLTLTPADHAGEVRVEARVAEVPDAPDALDRLRAELEQRGWSVAPADGSLEASLDGGTVSAAYAGPGLALTVDSAPLPVGAERAATLVRDGVLA
jgi:hypothetical protein